MRRSNGPAHDPAETARLLRLHAAEIAGAGTIATFDEKLAKAARDRGLAVAG